MKGAKNRKNAKQRKLKQLKKKKSNANTKEQKCLKQCWVREKLFSKVFLTVLLRQSDFQFISTSFQNHRYLSVP